MFVGCILHVMLQVLAHHCYTFVHCVRLFPSALPIIVILSLAQPLPPGSIISFDVAVSAAHYFLEPNVYLIWQLLYHIGALRLIRDIFSVSREVFVTPDYGRRICMHSRFVRLHGSPNHALVDHC